METKDENQVAARGSLVLTYDPELDQYWVSFADWYEHQGFGSLPAVCDWFEIFSDTAGHEVKLNGSQAQTVKKWAEEYL